MNAVVFHRHGGADTLVYEEAPLPTVGPGDVLVRVKACALNHLDIWIREGIPAFTVPLPHIGGSDVAGIVERVGAGVTGVGLGDRVFVAPGLSCWACEFCLSGRDNLCTSYHILGTRVNGGMAEFVVVPAVNVLPIPPGLSFEQAAAFPLTAVTPGTCCSGWPGFDPPRTSWYWGPAAASAPWRFRWPERQGPA